MGDRHEPWCETHLGPDFEVRPGEVRMTIFTCMGCKGEPTPAPDAGAGETTGETDG